jgi:hypothetical protein
MSTPTTPNSHPCLKIVVNYERLDGGFREEASFESWGSALEFARWVDTSSEHELLKVSLSSPQECSLR